MPSMKAPYSPSIRRRRLSARLRKYREALGKTTGEVAKDLGWQQTKISRIETGAKKTIQADELDALLDYYKEKRPEIRAELHECARLANERGWWSRYKNVLDSALPDFEAEASAIRTYECQVVPGLLQTPDYAEAIFRANLVRTEEEIQARVAARLKRQEILNRVDPPEYWVILDEAALRRVIGSPEVMKVQLRHLTHMATRHNINISVLPFSAGAHPSTMGSFVIIDFPNPLDASVGYAETPTSSVYVEEREELAELNAIFSGALASCLTPADSLKFIYEVIDSLEG